MKSLIYVFFIIYLLSSCSKTESEFIWEKSYGQGIARFIKASPDSGFIACGERDGNPYFVRLNKSRGPVLEFRNDISGSYSSAWFDTANYIAGGVSGNKILLNKFNRDGIKVWEKIIDPGFNVGFTKLFYRGQGRLLAFASTSADSEITVPSGISLILFDTTGLILSEEYFTDDSFLAASDAEMDDDDNVFLAVTRQETGAKSRAAIAKYNNSLQKIWETGIFNNTSFGGTAMAVKLDPAGDIYVAGKTELNESGGVIYNSFMASVSGSGSVNWTKYRESSNCGWAVNIDGNNSLVMLNRNCFIINFLEASDGADAGTVRAFSMCDSYNTDALGSDMDFNYDSNYLLAGTRGGSFYLALKQAK